MNTISNDLEFKQYPVTLCLILIMLVMGVICIRRQRIFAALILHPYSIVKKHEYYRIFTTDFVHNDFTHLILNCVSLYVFGSDLEESLLKKTAYGSLWFLTIFLSSMIVGNTLVSLIERNEFEYSSAGCSGSVMGCLFGFMLMNPFGKSINFVFVGGIENIYTAIIFILLMVLYSLKKKTTTINHQIHFYGAIGGTAATLILAHQFLF